MSIFRKILPVFLLLTFVFSGCGPQTSPMSGTATYDGQPIESGTVSLIPIETKEPAAGASASIADGKFTIPAKVGIVPGLYRISVEAIDKSKPIPATAETEESYGLLFSDYSFDHTFPEKGPYSLEIAVPKTTKK